MTLEVAAEGQIISKSVIFEYKEQTGAKSTENKDNSNTCMKEKYLRTLLLQKLEVLYSNVKPNFEGGVVYLIIGDGALIRKT